MKRTIEAEKAFELWRSRRTYICSQKEIDELPESRRATKTIFQNEYNNAKDGFIAGWNARQRQDKRKKAT